MNAVLSKLANEAKALTKEAAVDRLIGELEHAQIREKSRDERVEGLKKEARAAGAHSTAPKGSVNTGDWKQTVKIAAAGAVGTITAALSAGELPLSSLGATAGMALLVFLNRLLTNGGGNA